MHKEMRFLLRLWVDSNQDGSWRVSLVDIKKSEKRLSFKNLSALNDYLLELTTEAQLAENTLEDATQILESS